MKSNNRLKMKQLNIIIPVKIYAVHELDATDAALVATAVKACKSSYAPFSGFNVGAAVLLENGAVVSGSNQENDAYPSGLCAERVALFYANASYPDIPVTALAIASSVGGAVNQQPVYPCGACRQSLLQSEKRFGNNIRVLMAGSDTVETVESIKDLLPLSFRL
jgi:cytidine deaminase